MKTNLSNLGDSVAQFGAILKSAALSHLLPDSNALRAEVENTLAEQQNQKTEELGNGA